MTKRDRESRFKKALLSAVIRFGGTGVVAGRAGPRNHLGHSIEAHSRDNNRIPPATDILRQAQKAPTRILPELKCKQLAFYLNLLAEQFLVHFPALFSDWITLPRDVLRDRRHFNNGIKTDWDVEDFEGKSSILDRTAYHR